MNSDDLLRHRADIADLVYRYAHNMRHGKSADCAALFAPDGEFEIRELYPADPDSLHIRKHLIGREAIHDYVAAAAGHGIIVCPLIHNLLIEVDGDRAQANSMMTTRTWPGGYELVGEYHDSFSYRSGWLFQSRVYTILKAEV